MCGLAGYLASEAALGLGGLRGAHQVVEQPRAVWQRDEDGALLGCREGEREGKREGGKEGVRNLEVVIHVASVQCLI